MGKASSMAIVCALVLPLLLLRLTSVLAAVNVIYFLERSNCIGVGLGCANLSPNTCCVNLDEQVLSVLVDTSDPELISVFLGGGCTNLYKQFQDSRCVYMGGLTGVLWAPINLPANDSETYKVSNTCKAQIKPTDLVYVDDNAKGRWVLTTNDATELFLQMKNVPGAKVVDWLETHGAIFESSGL